MLLVYVDESGSPSSSRTDPNYPIFVMAACVFEPDVYASRLLPAVGTLKIRHLGSDSPVLHESEIRKRLFSTLRATFRPGLPSSKDFPRLSKIACPGSWQRLFVILIQKEMLIWSHLRPFGQDSSATHQVAAIGSLSGAVNVRMRQ